MKPADKSEPTPMRGAINHTLDGKPGKYYVDCDSFSDDDAFKIMLTAFNAKAKFVSVKKFKARKKTAFAPVDPTPDLPALAEAKAWVDELTKLAPLLSLIPKLSGKGIDMVDKAYHARANQLNVTSTT